MTGLQRWSKNIEEIFKRINWVGKLHLDKYAAKDEANANESVNALGERPRLDRTEDVDL